MAPVAWAALKVGASVGRIPVKVSVSDRAMVIAWFANEAEAVKQ